MKNIWKLAAIVALVFGPAACEKNPVDRLLLNANELQLAEGSKVALEATVTGNSDPVIWSSDNPDVVTVSDGVVTAVKVGQAKVIARSGELMAECTVSVFYDAPAVDLGLSVKWASFNIGAENEEESGSYFAWGETTEKSNFDWTTEGDYKWGILDESAEPLCGMTKYTAFVNGGDGLKFLQAEDDPASVAWGTKWRTPTMEEIDELFDDNVCTWSWDKVRKGYTITSIANGNSIFLPHTGYRRGSELIDNQLCGYYWSSLVRVFGPSLAYNLRYNTNSYEIQVSNRSYGLAVRAVTEK